MAFKIFKTGCQIEFYCYRRLHSFDDILLSWKEIYQFTSYISFKYLYLNKVKYSLRLQKNVTDILWYVFLNLPKIIMEGGFSWSGQAVRVTSVNKRKGASLNLKESRRNKCDRKVQVKSLQLIYLSKSM